MKNKSTSFKPPSAVVMMVTVTLAGFLPNLSAAAAESNDNGSNAQERIIAADMNNVEGPLDTSFKECVGAGRANEGLRADWQDQLRVARRECGFKYIRMHGLLTDDMGVYKEDAHGNPIYNWQYIDRLYDFLLSINVKPFVELSFMPKGLASGNKTIFWWRGNVTPPKSYDKWADLIRHLVIHFQDRYGQDEVKSWYFEVWNEPDLHNGFFTGTKEDYFKLYAVTAQAIKSVSPDYRVGGPATAMGQWDQSFIDFCHSNNVPLDFISSHNYGVKSGYLDETGQRGTVIDPDPDSVIGRMVGERKMIDQSPMPGLPLHFTEWSSAYTPTDFMHDTYQQAAFILSKVKGAYQSVNSMSYWTFTDIFEENGPRMTPFHGGFGLINYQDLKKPAFYAFKFLNAAGPVRTQGCRPGLLGMQEPGQFRPGAVLGLHTHRAAGGSERPAILSTRNPSQRKRTGSALHHQPSSRKLHVRDLPDGLPRQRRFYRLSRSQLTVAIDAHPGRDSTRAEQRGSSNGGDNTDW